MSNPTGGPKPEAGREVARWNATRHGIRSPASVGPGVKLSRLRKAGEVKDTGKTDGQSKEVSLVSSHLRDRDTRDTHGAYEKCRALEPGIVRTLEECIHAVPGGCWLCRKSNEGGKQTLVGDNRGGIGKANREEHRR